MLHVMYCSLFVIQDAEPHRRNFGGGGVLHEKNVSVRKGLVVVMLVVGFSFVGVDARFGEEKGTLAPNALLILYFYCRSNRTKQLTMDIRRK